MKKKWVGWIQVVLLVLVLTACGQKGIAGNLTAASGGVAGDDGLRDEQEEDRDEDLNWYANKDNVYEMLQTYDEKKDLDKNYLLQKKPDGTTVKRFYIKGLYELYRVTDQWIYYCVYREDDMDDENCRLSEVYRVPTGKKADGDHPALEKKELLFTSYHITDLCVLDPYIFYLDSEMEGEEKILYRYDPETKQTVPLMEGEKLEEPSFAWKKQEDKGPLMLQGQLFLLDENSLYSIEADNGECRQVFHVSKGDLSLLSSGREMERCGEYIYFSPDDKQIYRYGGTDKRAERVISGEAVQAKLEEICLWGEKGHDGEGGISGIMAYEDRLYFIVEVSWTQKMRLKLSEAAEAEEGGKEADWRCTRTILLSAQEHSPAELTYESAVSDYFAEHAKYVSQDKFGDRVHNEDSSIWILNEKEILLSCNGSRGFNSPVYAAYDPGTKKIRKVTKEEAGDER